MKPANLILTVAGTVDVLGWIFVIFAKTRFYSQVGVWLLVASFVILALPLLFLLMHELFRGKDSH